jgi:methyl-accepting chemotaxis protein
VVVRQHGRTLASTSRAAARLTLPRQGSVTVRGAEYPTVTQRSRGFGGPVASVLSSVAATASSVTASRWIAIAFILGFVVLAFAFSVVASRALAGQLGRFLHATRRLGTGDFSSPIPIEGRDEFAALGEEFNRMSDQLAHRIDEFAEGRVRQRESIRRIGETFASNLDRQAPARAGIEDRT